MDALCAIDIGSTVCRVLIGRPDANDSMQIIGVGAAPSRGVRAGSIVNIDATIQSITQAAQEAQLMSGLLIEEAVISITGKHLKGENSRGVVAVTNRDRVVRESDVLRVIEGAQNIRIPADQEILHVLSREFTVDDQGGIRDPIGMTGVRLEAEVHIVTAGVTAITNLNKALAGAQMQISSCVMSSLASSEAVLGSAEKDMGVVVVDIGGGVADIIGYLDGGVYFSSVVPLGGIYVTQDISIGLKIPIETAEMVKKTHGCSLVSIVDPTEKVEIPGISGRPPKSVLRQTIAEIIEPRMKEILEHVDAEIMRCGKKSQFSGGVVLTGGGSLIEGTVSLAEETLGMVVSPGMPQGISGFSERAGGPEFATAAGLLFYASRMGERTYRPEQAGEGMMSRIKKWIVDNL